VARELPIEETAVGGIPVLVCRDEGAGLRPLVLCSHGFTGSKEDWRGKLEALARRGYLAVAMDNPLHGARAGAGFESLLHEGRLDLLGVRRLARDTANDLRVLIGAFSEESDTGRVACVGVSLGGFATFRALADDARIDVACTIIASPHWDDIPGDRPVLSDEPPDLRDPADDLAAIPPRALQMQVGAEDRHYDPARVASFYDELRPLYDDADRLELVVHPGVAHEFTDEMWARALGWLERHL
jgi:pimeloyl-ACP methyl ester carboxylesterase